MILTVVLFFSSCVQQATSRRATDGDGSVNVYRDIPSGYGRILPDNPIIMSGNSNLPLNANLGAFARTIFLTNNEELVAPCLEVTNCIKVLEYEQATPLLSKDAKWAYSTNSLEFLQVQTFYHVKKLVNYFQELLKSNFDLKNTYDSSIPDDLYTNKRYWHTTRTLLAYANADEEIPQSTAAFHPSYFSMYFGELEDYPGVKMVDDPSVIYHETGHALIDVMLNMRNASVPLRSDFGMLYYDESGGIGEGIADYFSYAMNKRTHFGEWALGRFMKISRPLSEEDDLHMLGISRDSDSRVSYPKFLNYEPNYPNLVIEDVHNAGLVTSHFLVALTEEYMNACSKEKSESIAKVIGALMNTFSALGDITTFFGKEWTRIANPPNYRKFYKYFAYYFVELTKDSSCYNKADLEILLDKYGLLLFDFYLDNTGIDLSHRLSSILVPKDYIRFDPTFAEPKAYIFDDPDEINTAIESMRAGGQILEISPQFETEIAYNNGNSEVSPGEIVGLALNLYNSSNSPIAGIQILGNDWDHVSGITKLPCTAFGDDLPTDGSGDDDASCNYVTRYNGEKQDLLSEQRGGTEESAEFVAPICLVQINGEESARLSLQREMVNELPSKKYCLDGGTNLDQCFLRTLKGADMAYFSKIDPKSTWAQTIGQGELPEFNYSNLIFFEVNSYTPPGTTFHCRFRVRFTNCSDCFVDPNTSQEYEDFEYSGNTPFKLLNLQFTVIR